MRTRPTTAQFSQAPCRPHAPASTTPSRGLARQSRPPRASRIAFARSVVTVPRFSDGIKPLGPSSLATATLRVSSCSASGVAMSRVGVIEPSMICPMSAVRCTTPHRGHEVGPTDVVRSSRLRRFRHLRVRRDDDDRLRSRRALLLARWRHVTGQEDAAAHGVEERAVRVGLDGQLVGVIAFGLSASLRAEPRLAATDAPAASRSPPRWREGGGHWGAVSGPCVAGSG